MFFLKKQFQHHNRSIDGYVRDYDIRMGIIREDQIGRNFYFYFFLLLFLKKKIIIAPVTNATFSRDGNCILAHTLDNTIRLLDRDTGHLLST